MLIELAVGVFIALVMFLTGLSIQALKKIVKVVTSFICSMLAKIGIHLERKEKDLKVDESIFNDYKEIKSVKRGALGMKYKKSINVFALILFLVSLALIIGNLEAVTGNAITKWLSATMISMSIDIGSIDMNTIYTAVVFSVLSFSLTKLLGRWKETSAIRRERKHTRLKKNLLSEMTSEELILEAEKKDREKIERRK